MFRSFKKTTSIVTAAILVVVMSLTMFPIGLLVNAFAATVDNYTVTLTYGSSAIDLDGVQITLTNKADNAKKSTQSTTKGVATFENFVEEGASYTASIAEVTGYETIPDFDITPLDGETNYDVSLTAIAQVPLKGVVKDENGTAYKGATVKVSGYVTATATTGEDGTYSFMAYKGKNYTVTATAKEEKYETASTSITNLSETQPASELRLKIKEFPITTSCDSNGTITATDTGVTFGNNKTITAAANAGYCIESFRVDGVELPEAKTNKDFTYKFTNVTGEHTVHVSFMRQTYKITFKVNENGKVEYTDGTKQSVEGGLVEIAKVFNESEDPENPTKVIVDAIPNKNYRVSKIIADDAEQTFSENNKTVEGIEFIMTEDHTFVVEFKLNQFTVKANHGEHGEATVNNELVDYNGSAIVTITPEEGYEISSLKVNGSDVEPEGDDFAKTYTLNMKNITENKTIDIEYSPITTSTVSNKIDNDKYTITFTYENKTYSPVVAGNQYIVPNGTVVKVVPKAPYIRSSINWNTLYIGTTSTIRKNIKITEVDLNTTNHYLKWEKVEDINIEIIFDTNAPAISDITKEPNKAFNNNEYTISASVNDDYAGVDKVYYSATNDFATATEANFDSVTNKATFKTSSEENNYEYFIWAVDKVGNRTTGKDVKSIPIAIDKTKPAIDKFEFSSNSLNICEFGTFSHEDIKVLVTASDTKSTTTNSGIASITLNGQTVEASQFKNGKAEFTLKAADFSATKEVSATAADNAGNVSDITIPTAQNSNIKSNKITISNVKANVVSERKDNAKYIDGEKYWYAGNTDFTVKVTDEFGIKSVVIKMNGKEVVNAAYDTGANAVKSMEYTINTSENPFDGINEITVDVVNVNNNSSNNADSSSKSVYIDTTAPDITNFEITRVGKTALDKVLNFLTFGVFFNDKVEVTVTADDVNATAGVKSITLYANGEVFDTKEVDKENKSTFTIPTEDITDETMCFNKVLSAIATDHVDNSTQVAVEPTTENSDIANSKLMIETIEPTVAVHYAAANNLQNEKTQKNGEEWYNSDVEFTVIPSDNDSGLRNVFITINDEELVNEDLFSSEVHSKEYKVNTKDVTIKEDGSYTLKVVVTDNAGNVNIKNSYTKTIFKDTDKPYITGFHFEPEQYVEGSGTATSVEVTDYGFYFKENTKVTISSKDDAPTAGIKEIIYYTVDKDAGKSEEISKPVKADGTIEFTIEKDFKGQIYAKAVDNVQNVQNEFVNPNSAIVEKEDKHKEEEHIAFAKDNASFAAKNGSELYSANVPVTITVTDTYSGIRGIEWEVVAPYDTVNNQSGKVTLNNDKSVTGGSDSGWEQTKTEVNLVTEMKKTITVKNNSNDIVVRVKMMDRAGNTSEKEVAFSIDKTKPVIEVTYDNTVPDDTYKDIYKENRIATIKVTERNFDSKDIKYQITNTDGVIPALSEWKETKNSENPDETYYSATVAYTADGDYTFDISYSDLAGNAAEKFVQHAFTVDKTIPVLTVAYDNNSALNGNYYKEDRTATITIIEHNFDPSRVNVIGTATDNGTTLSFPTTSSWTDHGDTHVATINYSFDSRYTFDVEFSDMAGNPIADYTPEEFYVDKTAPTLEISGVGDKSANNGTIAPIVTYTDTNFNKDAVVIELKGVNNNKVNYAASIKDIDNGQEYAYANFEKVQKVDDIYTLSATLTDKAGNETKKEIIFSVNRFGSVYSFDTFLKNMEGKYTNAEQDVVFTETNVDTLDHESIQLKLFKDGTPADLKEGEDYTVTHTGGDGTWSQYKYVVSKALFANDGKYRMTVYSKDRAGNVNENIEESKKAEISFGIDKTKPVIVPVDFESGKQYPVEVKTVKAEIKDNLVLEKVKIYLGEEKEENEVKYAVDGETYTFDIPQANEKQTVIFVASDAAANEYKLPVEDFLVTTNIFVRWYNNTPLFIGSITGVVVLAVGLAAFLIFGKKKKKVDEAK